MCSVECVSEACVDFLLQQLTVENAVGFYTYARGYFLPRYSHRDHFLPRYSHRNHFLPRYSHRNHFLPRYSHRNHFLPRYSHRDHFLLQQLTVENAVGFYTYAWGYFFPR